MTFFQFPVFMTIKSIKIMTTSTIRYTDTALKEFQTLVESKLAKAAVQLFNLKEQLEDANDNNDSGYDPDDNSNSFVDKEFLQEMIYRQERHIRDLENALLRIRNKTYGICEVTGSLIDKKRLMAVPTTTKSLAAKLNPVKPIREERPAPLQHKERVITTKVHKKPSAPVITKIDEHNDLEINFLEDEDGDEEWIIVPFDEEMEGLE